MAVLSTLQVPGHPEGYVIGALAYFEEGGSPLPMVRACVPPTGGGSGAQSDAE